MGVPPPERKAHPAFSVKRARNYVLVLNKAKNGQKRSYNRPKTTENV